MSKTRVLIVDDHPLFRRGLADWLNQQEDLVCCGEADSVIAARRAVADLRPDVVLMDIRLRDGDGLDLTRELIEFHPTLRILTLSQNEDTAFAHRALLAGSRGYIMKSEATDTIRAAIQTVIRGEVWLSPSSHAVLLRNLFPDPRPGKPQLAKLSDRELQVFQLLGSGLGTRAIADHLKVSPKTVETFREHLKDKLNLPDGKTLVAAARQWFEKGRLDGP